MDAVRLFLTWQKFDGRVFSGKPVSGFSTFNSSAFFRYSFHSFFKTQILSSALSNISGTVSYPDEILPNLTLTTLRGRARGTPRAHDEARGRAQEQGWWETQRKWFSTALLLSANSVNRSPAQESEPTFDAASLLQTPVVLSSLSSSTTSSSRSHTKLAQGSTGTIKFQL